MSRANFVALRARAASAGAGLVEDDEAIRAFRTLPGLGVGKGQVM